LNSQVFLSWHPFRPEHVHIKEQGNGAKDQLHSY